MAACSESQPHVKMPSALSSRVRRRASSARAFYGEHIGEKNILATDMGGTTFKVSVVRDGVIERDYKPVILRHSILSTKIWVESIGAGGGSIAWIDPDTGLLKVGPQGAGASPGPVCYDVGGTRPDGVRCRPRSGLSQSGLFPGRPDEAEQSRRPWTPIREKIAKPLNMSEVEAAAGIYRIANSHMSDLIRKATVEKGHDPRNFRALRVWRRSARPCEPLRAQNWASAEWSFR